MLLQPSRTKRTKPPSRIKPILMKTIGVIVLVAVVGVGSRGCINAVTARSIDNNTVGVRKVDVASGDVPAIFNFWVLGGLKNGSITLHDIVATPVNISSLQVTAANLRFSRTKMLSGKARLDGSPPYRTTIFLSPKNLSDSLNATVSFQSNYLVATIDGHNMHVIPKLDGRTIVIEDDRYTYEVPLPGAEYLPCTPDRFGVGGGVSVSCESAKLPEIVADATR